MAKIKDGEKNDQVTPIAPQEWAKTAGGGAGVVATGVKQQVQAGLAQLVAW